MDYSLSNNSKSENKKPIKREDVFIGMGLSLLLFIFTYILPVLFFLGIEYARIYGPTIIPQNTFTSIIEFTVFLGVPFLIANTILFLTFPRKSRKIGIEWGYIFLVPGILFGSFLLALFVASNYPSLLESINDRAPKTENVSTSQNLNASSNKDWKTYADAEHGFEIKYPVGATISHITDDVLGNQTSTLNECTLIAYRDSFVYISLPPHQVICGGTTGLGIGDARVEENVIIGGQTQKVSGWRMKDGGEFLYAGSGSTSITYGVDNWSQLDDNRYQAAKDLDYQMLSTFKFTK